MADREMVRMAWDREHGQVVVTFADGSEASAPFVDSAVTDTTIKRTTIDLQNWAALIDLASGQRVVAEAGGADSPWLRWKRPVVYLDQWVWVHLAQALHTPTKVDPAELRAAAQVIDWANSMRVIFPLSTGHLAETGVARDRYRATLVPTMLHLSRGWQMRDLLSVQHDELTRMFAAMGEHPLGEGFSAPEVMTLDEGGIFHEFTPASSSLPPGSAQVHRFITWITSHYSAMLDDERLDNSHGMGLATRWTTGFHNLAQQLRTNTAARADSRHIVFAWFVGTINDEVVRAAASSGIAPATATAWVTSDSPADHLAALPFVGTLYESIHARVRNAGDRWTGNDFVDMHYLGCASAYADIIVCENKAADYLTRAWRGRPGGATILTSLQALVEHLDSSLPPIDPATQPTTSM